MNNRLLEAQASPEKKDKQFIPIPARRPADRNRKMWANPYAHIFLPTFKRVKIKAPQKPLHLTPC